MTSMLLVVVGFFFMLYGEGEIGFGLMMIGLVMLAAEWASLQENKKMSDCPPHKWTRHETGVLWCPKCKSRPGVTKDDGWPS